MCSLVTDCDIRTYNVHVTWKSCQRRRKSNNVVGGRNFPGCPKMHSHGNSLYETRYSVDGVLMW